MTNRVTRALPPPRDQDDDGVISYPHAAVPRLESAAHPAAFNGIVHRLLACAPGKRASVAEAFEVMGGVVPVNLSAVLSASSLAHGAAASSTTVASGETSIDLWSSGVGSLNS